jgi:CubicO group peptidase (beta-lactamase class C family)
MISPAPSRGPRSPGLASITPPLIPRSWVRSLPESQASRSPTTCPRNCGVHSAPRRRRGGYSISPAARDVKWPEGHCRCDCATRPADPYVQFGKLSPNDGLGYGYQWWCLPGPHHRFAAEGIHGQFVLVDPEEHLVVVKLSSWKHAWEDDKEAETYAFFAAIADAVR